METRPLFPPPPAYFESFTNVKESESEITTKDDKDCSESQIQPPSPLRGPYSIFSELQEEETGIPKLTVEQLFPDKDLALDFRNELQRLHEEVKECYANLITTVVDNPERYARLTERLGVLLRNMLQLINLMRPYQAISSIEEFFTNGIQLRKQALEEVEKCQKEIHRRIEEGISKLTDEG